MELIAVGAAAIGSLFIQSTIKRLLISEIDDLLGEAIKADGRVIQIVVNGVVHTVKYLIDGVVVVVNRCGETIRDGFSKLIKLIQEALEAGACLIKFIVDKAVRNIEFVKANGMQAVQVNVRNTVGHVVVEGKVKVQEFDAFVKNLLDQFAGSHSLGHLQ